MEERLSEVATIEEVLWSSVLMEERLSEVAKDERRSRVESRVELVERARAEATMDEEEDLYNEEDCAEVEEEYVLDWAVVEDDVDDTADDVFA